MEILTEINIPKNKLKTTLELYLNPTQIEEINDVLDFAEKSHKDQKRISGEPYIIHPIATAQNLAEMKLDTTTIKGALLHDVIEDCNVSYNEIEKLFGSEVAYIVDGATKLKNIDKINESSQMAIEINTPQRTRSATLRKILIAMTKDVRVVLIKLSDRLHNMQTLKYLPASRQLRIARETLDIHAPLAHRLGMNEIKWKLEDESFRYLNPENYKMISKLVARKRLERERYVNAAVESLKTELEKSNIKSLIYGRAKHLYSIYKKINRYQEIGRKFNEIHDLFALRILTDNINDCYKTLGIVHSKWRPLQGEFDDYIGNPKENMYQSLHTSVIGPGNYSMEIQIRTKEMEKIAQEGVASHWSYKEGEQNVTNGNNFEQQITWLKQILEWQQEFTEDEEYLSSVKTDILSDQVFVYTPKGDVIDLPIGATPLDFAYRVHTELGHNATRAYINNKIVALNTILQNGDLVEIKKSRKNKGPNINWLNPELNFLSSIGAQTKVRQWFNKQNKNVIEREGKKILNKELTRLSIDLSESEIAEKMDFTTTKELIEALGSGTIPITRIAEAIDRTENKIKNNNPSVQPGVLVVIGEQDLLTKIGRCCNPIHGDEIIGYLTRNQDVTVHKISCNNAKYSLKPEKIVDVNWGEYTTTYSSRLIVNAYDRVGLIRDITMVVSSEGVNIHKITSSENKGSNAVNIAMTVYTRGVQQLSKLFSRLEAIPGIESVIRINE
ncbi:MAG: (p)ppGpp synthetase [Chloroflexi bacterium]|nr:(p)ppGpp synthetase [Chloroflexota bacterium]|tara:strand:- start:35518 stop:37698 length:2181 start_codon:yes stop_codon:yes gene_type:complete